MSLAFFIIFSSMYFVSPLNRLPFGSYISQFMRAVFLFSILSGSITKLLGSGLAILSDSSIVAYPAMDDASNGMPSSNASSNLLEGITMFFGVPRMSTNCNLTNTTLFSFTIFNTSFLVLILKNILLPPHYKKHCIISNAFALFNI